MTNAQNPQTRKRRARVCAAFLSVFLLSIPHSRPAAADTYGRDIYFGASAGSRPLYFLALPTSAATLGRGTVSASGAMDASDVLRFPANTPLAGGGQFFFGASWQGNDSHAFFAAAALPIFRDGALGLFAQSTPMVFWPFPPIDVGNIDIGNINMPELPALPSPNSLAYNLWGLSFAKYFPEYGYGFGFSASFYQSAVWDQNAGAFGENEMPFAAFGADFRFDPAEFLTGRAYFSSAGIPVSGDSVFERRFAEQYGLMMNYSRYLGERGFWKTNLGAGARKTTWDGALEVGFGAEFIAGGRYIMRLGWEAPTDAIAAAVSWAWNDFKYFLGSGEVNIDKFNKLLILYGWGAGLGVKAGSFGVDAAYRPGPDGLSNAIWSVNATLEIEEMKKRSAEDNLTLARNYYADERFDKSRFYADRAVSEDSALWSAAPLRAMSEAELRRRADGSVAIIYGGNSRGTVVPYPPSDEALGGLSRYAALVSRLREKYPVSFTVDAGNLISAGKDALRIEFAAGYYDAARFDVLAPGIGEVSMGAAKLAAALKSKTPVIVTNLNDNDAAATGIRSGVLLTNGGYSVYLLNIIQTVPENEDGTRIDLSYDPFAIKSQLASGQAAAADLRVAVVHGTLEEVTHFAGEFDGALDVVIAGSLDRKLENPVKAGNTLIVSAGAENKFAGCLFVKFGDVKKAVKTGGKAAAAPARTGKGGRGARAKPRFTAENVLFPVDQDIEPDAAVEKITKLVRAAIIVGRGDSPNIRTRVRGVTAHLSDRGAGPQAFLKSAQGKNELLLGDSVFDCRRPLLSSSGDRAALISGKPENKNGKLKMVDLAMGASKTVSAAGKNVIDAAFSPTGNLIYYIEADSGGDTGAIRKTKMYMNDAITVLEAGASQRDDIDISSDGETILFASKPKDGKWDIYALDTSGKAAPVRLTDGKADHRRPRISPDGNYVAYLSNRTGFGGKMDLWVYDRRATKHRQLTFDTEVQGFTWSDNSEDIYFSAGVNLLEICRVDMRHGAIKNMIPHPQSEIKSWSESSPRFMRYNDEPMIVYTRVYADGRRRIYWFDINSAADAKMYAVGEFDEWNED